MSTNTIRERLMRLEAKQRFLSWLLTSRLLQSFTFDESETFIREGTLPDRLPEPRGFEGLAEKELLNLWREEEKIVAGRSREDFKHYCETGLWNEERGCFEYFMQGENLVIKWCKPADAEETRHFARLLDRHK